MLGKQNGRIISTPAVDFIEICKWGRGFHPSVCFAEPPIMGGFCFINESLHHRRRR